MIVSIIIVYLIQTYDNSNLHLGAFISFVQYFIVIKAISHAPAKNVIISVFASYIIQALTQHNHNHFYDSHLTEFQIVDLCGILLDNALEASRAKDTIYIEIGTPIQENASGLPTPFSITVKNPGPEASQDFVKKIFPEGYTSKIISSEEHGLGLPYIKSLVQKHHGYIEVSNEIIVPDGTKKSCRY